MAKKKVSAGKPAPFIFPLVGPPVHIKDKDGNIIGIGDTLHPSLRKKAKGPKKQ